MREHACVPWAECYPAELQHVLQRCYIRLGMLSITTYVIVLQHMLSIL